MIINMKKQSTRTGLENLPVFSKENYYEDFPHGARFMLFEGPNSTGYIRISTSQDDNHDDITKRFFDEIRTSDRKNINQYHPNGGGFYRFRSYNSRTGKTLEKPLIEFGDFSATYGRYDENLLHKILDEGKPPLNADWKILKK